MRLSWLLTAVVVLVVALPLRSAVAEMCKEEIRTRLELLPYGLIRLAIWRLPRNVRGDVGGEWRGELAFILQDTDGLPLTRLARGVRYAASLLLSARSVGLELSGDEAEVGYIDATTCKAAGITRRQLDYWERSGLVTPSLGRRDGERLYTFRDILILKVVKRLLDTGVSLQQIRAAVQHLRAKGTRDLPVVTLMSDGISVYECMSPDEVVDLLVGGQGIFGIALGRVWSEIENTLADLMVEPPPS